jgi:hypothetical protein
MRTGVAASPEARTFTPGAVMNFKRMRLALFGSEEIAPKSRPGQ